MQTTSIGIWTWVVESTSYDDNRYIMSTLAPISLMIWTSIVIAIFITFRPMHYPTLVRYLLTPIMVFIKFTEQLNTQTWGCLEYLQFQSGHPFKFWTDSLLLNISYLTGNGAFGVSCIQYYCSHYLEYKNYQWWMSV